MDVDKDGIKFGEELQTLLEDAKGKIDQDEKAELRKEGFDVIKALGLALMDRKISNDELFRILKEVGEFADTAIEALQD